MSTFSNDFTPKLPKKFSCEICDFHTCNKKDFTRHNNTAKHNSNVIQCSATDFTPKYPNYICTHCGKKYKDNSGLWRHKKKCVDETTKNSDKELIFQILKQNTELIKENTEFKQLMSEQTKTITELATKSGYNVNNNCSNFVNNTNNFNLNLYLNETCKNAMNIMDFINQLQINITDLEETGRLGFAGGISRIFINGLKQMSVTDRPIHCSDLKRETLYIKDNNEWNKDNEHKTMLTNAIKQVANKNIRNISLWTKKNPEYNDPSTKVNDKYLKIVCESMSGSSKEEADKNYAKIIKNIVKETVIEK